MRLNTQLEKQNVKDQLAALEKKLKEIETNLSNQTIFMDSEAKMLLLKKDIEKIMEEKTKGAMI